MTQLVAVVEGQVMGRIASSREGQLSFRYEPAWLEQEGAIQLSTAMPLAPLELWGKQYGVSPNNPFKLLLNVGEDVPGAAQLVREERLASYLDGGEFAIAWLTMDEVDLRLRTVKENAAALEIGEHHAVAQIGLEDWRTLAKDCELDEDQVLGWLSEMGEALPDHVSAVREQALLDGLNAEVIEPLSEQLLAHVQARLATITTRYFGGG